MNTMNEQAIHISPSDQFHGFPSRFFRTRKGRLSKIIIIEVNNKNFGTVWPKLLDSVTNATFISIDLELSGLGIPKGWHIKSLEEQYGVIRKSAQSHSVLSFGISTFRLIKRKETKAKKNIVFKCQVFNILTLQSPSFVVETTGLQFLLKHKFDFNRLIDLGISYDNISKDENVIKMLWHHILCASVPVALHNGFVDLAFIYEHFYSILPETFNEFVSNISDWFTLAGNVPGLYDSKYIAQNSNEFKASFLEYVFRKCQRGNAIERIRDRLFISVKFDLRSMEGVLTRDIDVADCKLPGNFNENDAKWHVDAELTKILCPRFAQYKFCNSEVCPFLHDVDILLSLEDEKQSKIRKRRKRRYDYESKLATTNGSLNGSAPVVENKESKNDISECSLASNLLNQSEQCALHSSQSVIDSNPSGSLPHALSDCHRAGVDSFMTGFAVIFMHRMNLLRSGTFEKNSGNRIVLPGKINMVIHRSIFVRSAKDHIEKLTAIQNERNKKLNQEEGNCASSGEF